MRGSSTERYGTGWRELAASILRRDEHRCHWCGDAADTADHVIPKALGGTDEPSNLVAACRRCNYGRTARIGHQARSQPSAT